MHWLKDAFLLMTLSMAVLTDFRDYKVPNALIINGILIGGLLSWLTGGFHGLVDGLLGCLFPAVVLMFLYRLSMIGAGDVKLLMAAGAFMGWTGSMMTVLFSFVTGAVISFTLLIKYGILLNRLKYFSCYLSRVRRQKKPDIYYDLKRPEKGETIHFSFCVFLAAGGVLAFLQ